MTDQSKSKRRDRDYESKLQLEREYQIVQAYAWAQQIDEDVRAARFSLDIREGGFKKKRGDKEVRDEAAIKKWWSERIKEVTNKQQRLKIGWDPTNALRIVIKYPMDIDWLKWVEEYVLTGIIENEHVPIDKGYIFGDLSELEWALVEDRLTELVDENKPLLIIYDGVPEPIALKALGELKKLHKRLGYERPRRRIPQESHPRKQSNPYAKALEAARLYDEACKRGDDVLPEHPDTVLARERMNQRRRTKRNPRT